VRVFGRGVRGGREDKDAFRSAVGDEEWVESAEGVSDGLDLSVLCSCFADSWGCTVPSRFPSVGPANEMKISAPQAAAFFRPSASWSSPWMMEMLALEESSVGILEGVRT
jgi:hypothetical protein